MLYSPIHFSQIIGIRLRFNGVLALRRKGNGRRTILQYAGIVRRFDQSDRFASRFNFRQNTAAVSTHAVRVEIENEKILPSTLLIHHAHVRAD